MRNQVGQGLDQRPIDGAGALRTAEHEHCMARRWHLKRKVRQGFFSGLQGDGLTYGVTDQDPVLGEKRERLRKRQEYPIHPFPQERVQLAGNAVLFVEKDPGWRQAEFAQ